MRILRWLGILVVVLVVAIGVVFVAARFHDGPLGMIAGGPLEHGELVTGPEPDWAFVHDVPTWSSSCCRRRDRAPPGSSRSTARSTSRAAI